MLYEPTNITPSTLNGTGAVDVNDNVNISWQVNGNSKLTGFKIDIYINDVLSSLVHTTGQIPASFYGRNQLGEVQLFTYSLNATWASWGMTNGNEYKFRITQYYNGGSIVQRSFSAFNTYATPTVSMSVTNNRGQAVSGTLNTSIFNATAVYMQAQGNNIRNVRWQLSENGVVIDDTGFIQTADLRYEYAGAQNGNDYVLSVIVISEAGQSNTANQSFSVEYTALPYNPNFTAVCECRQYANLLQWDSSNNGFMLYRADGVSGTRRELVRLPSTVGQLKDYGLRSDEEYTYTFYAYDNNGAFIGETEQTVQARQFQRYSLLATKYSEVDGCYHVYKEYQFGCNVQNMSVSNNANSSYVQNFTPYPTRMYSSANYASGTLQALIGFVDRHSYRYFDDTKLMDELNALSTADYVLFLKDMKGHIRMVAPNGAVTQTVNNKSPQMEVTISFSWVEIGDASKVSIIQLPTDEGWNNDAQLLDVKIGVDYNTGELIVTYPFPYYGTRFLYNKNNGTLGTNTPADVTPRKVVLDTNPESDTSGAVLADKTNNGGNE